MHFVFILCFCQEKLALWVERINITYFVFLGLYLFLFSSTAKRVCTTEVFQKQQLKREFVLGNHFKLRFNSVGILGLEYFSLVKGAKM